MHESCPAIAGALRAIRGESDVGVVLPAFGDLRLSRVIALASSAHAGIHAVAALCGKLPALLDARTNAEPELHDAMARLIGTREGGDALWVLAHVVPAGWGAAHARDIVTAVQNRRCAPRSAAALIGPDDEVAALLSAPEDIAFAVRRWGRAVPDAPTAWMDALSPQHRRRLLKIVQRDPSAIASCLPWLPPDMDDGAPLSSDAIRMSLNAFTVASSTVRAMHAPLLRRLIADARPEHLGDLTRLACATDMEDVWDRIGMHLQECAGCAGCIVTAAPWNDVPESIRTAILQQTRQSPMCAAIAAARGHATTRPSSLRAAAFFAALDPEVWDALASPVQRQWIHALPGGDMALAVRSLGLRLEVLAHARITNRLVHAAQRHVRETIALSAALFPGALRDLPTTKAHALIAALPAMPDDPGAFFCLAGGRSDPDVIPRARTALRTPANLAVAVALQRSADGDRIQDACAQIAEALRDRTWTDLAPILSLAPDAVRAPLMRDRDDLAVRLAHRVHRERMRAILARMADLPPDVALPALFVLAQRKERHANAHAAASAVAISLQRHGDLSVEIVDTLADDDMRAELLPSPNHAPTAEALRALARDDPSAAQRLAHALQRGAWDLVLAAIRATPQGHAESVLMALWESPAADAHPIVGAITAHLTALAAEGEADALITRWRRLSRTHPNLALAILALPAHDPAQYPDKIATIAAHAQMLRTLFPLLRSDMRTILRRHPVIDIALADLQETASSPSGARWKRRTHP